ncbi:TIM barrel protein [Cytophagaceae bacterium ABcell3]|nr:TIM barrel protein [Cytophagaceae bacterium ABcell3]
MAREKFDIDAVEYVNQFFADKATDKGFLNQLKRQSEDLGVKNLLIMVDGEGNLADRNKKVREKAAENHFKWIEAAKFLGCHSIRINLHGDHDEDIWKDAAIDGWARLAAFGAEHDIHVLAENHGQWSSKASLVVEVLKAVDNPYAGTLPDFGNFCVRREKGDLWESPCVETYDKYKGVKELLPFAKGVSAKAFDFDEKGNETTIDYGKMLSLIKQSGFKGYLGIEYDGDRLDEVEGIMATKRLLEKTRELINE